MDDINQMSSDGPIEWEDSTKPLYRISTLKRTIVVVALLLLSIGFILFASILLTGYINGGSVTVSFDALGELEIELVIIFLFAIPVISVGLAIISERL